MLDAYALEAYLTMEHAGPLVRDLILSGEQLLISGINLAEAMDRMVRINGADASDLAVDIAQLGLTVSGVDEHVAVDAAVLRAGHYHRVRRPVSLADCCAAALALDRDAALATSDPPLLAMVHDEGGRVIPLPDSSGAVWSPGAV